VNQAQPVVTLKNVCKEYPGAGEAIKVLQNLDLEILPASRTAIVGPSGCGKSTLLKLVGLLDAPTSGEITFQGNDVGAISRDEAAGLRNRQLGFVFQSHMLLPQCTVLENVLIPTLINGTMESHVERAKFLLDQVGMSRRLHHRPAQLSGGESQRVAVVRALINRPALLLADEPTGSLNEEAAANLADLLLDVNKEEGIAVLVVTHSRLVAQRLENILELRNGKLSHGA
jgi:ABC-type lipoprotein export system ATPase subunit